MSKVTNQPRVPSSPQTTGAQGPARELKPSGTKNPLDTFETANQGDHGMRNTVGKGRSSRGTLTSIGDPSTYEPPSSDKKPERPGHRTHRAG